MNDILAIMLSERHVSVSPLSVYYICSYCTAAAAEKKYANGYKPFIDDYIYFSVWSR